VKDVERLMGGKHIGADQCPIVIQGTGEREANETLWEKERKRKGPASNAMLVMETRPYIGSADWWVCSFYGGRGIKLTRCVNPGDPSSTLPAVTFRDVGRFRRPSVLDTPFPRWLVCLLCSWC